MAITHAKVSAIPDGADATLVRPSDWNADHVGDFVTAGSGTVSIPGLAGSADIVPASPDANDDEFDVTDTSDPMTGWTTLGTPTAHDINSTVQSNYYVRKNAGALSLTGIYKAVPSMPFTVSAKLSAYAMAEGSGRSALFIGEATPGQVVSLGRAAHNAAAIVTDNGYMYIDNWTNPTTYGSLRTGPIQLWGYLYLRFVVASSTDVSAYVSNSGVLWTLFGAASFNPGFTVASVGLCIDPNATGPAVEAAFDWIRFT